MLDSARNNSKEFYKNCIKDFLRDSFNYHCNTRGKADLTIYNDRIPNVLFEVKSLNNKAEFIKSPNLSLQKNKARHKSLQFIFARQFSQFATAKKSSPPPLRSDSYFVPPPQGGGG